MIQIIWIIKYSSNEMCLIFYLVGFLMVCYSDGTGHLNSNSRPVFKWWSEYQFINKMVIWIPNYHGTSHLVFWFPLLSFCLFPVASLFNALRKVFLQFSRGEICVSNFIPPANGASQGNYFQANIPKMAVFEAKTGKQKLRRHPNLQTFL